MYSKLTADQLFQLEKQKLKTQGIIFGGLLSAVTVLNLSPLVLGVLQRPADSTVAGIKESSLLLTGAIGSAASFFLTGKSMGSSTPNVETIMATKPEDELVINEKTEEEKSSV
jgi:hypothetical protein